jgi:serine/threonine-protein kinase
VIAAGQTVGNYRILNKIGTGGMGAVYLAEHPLIGKRVALKVIHRELAGNRDVVSRFFQEARSVNKIGNEHIVEIHDFGVTPEGDHFFIMEYLEGRTLASILSREKALDIMRALHVGAQIAAALAAAHAAGIIHRDLKPDNIMLMSRLGDQDFVKVLDFGLAKVFSAATAVKTAAGVLLGTPQYMSPEACESKGDVDHRTDIYALGILLFQMMTGVLPFDGESMGEVLVKQVTALPPVPRALNPAIPPSVEQILLRCLAKRVDARFATMQQLRDALLDPEAYLRGSPPIAPARSVGSGEGAVDAKTVMVQAAALQKTRVAAPQGMPLPLPAPAVSMIGVPMAPSGGSPAIGQAATVLAGGSVEYAPPRRASSAMPWLAPPLEPKMNTMRIATPLGYSSRPPRKVWPLVLVGSLLLGLAGGIFAVARFGHAGGPPRAPTAPPRARLAPPRARPPPPRARLAPPRARPPPARAPGPRARAPTRRAPVMRRTARPSRTPRAAPGRAARILLPAPPVRSHRARAPARAHRQRPRGSRSTASRPARRSPAPTARRSARRRSRSTGRSAISP